MTLWGGQQCYLFGIPATPLPVQENRGKQPGLQFQASRRTLGLHLRNRGERDVRQQDVKALGDCRWQRSGQQHSCSQCRNRHLRATSRCHLRSRAPSQRRASSVPALCQHAPGMGWLCGPAQPSPASAVGLPLRVASLSPRGYKLLGGRGIWT